MSNFVDWAQKPIPVTWDGSVSDGSAFGYDVSAIPDLSTGTEQTGYVSLGEAIYRRLTSPNGSLFYDPAYGFDLRAWVNENDQPGTDPGSIYATLAVLVAQEVEKDERVDSAAVEVVQFDLRSGAIRITCTLAQGLVRYVVSWMAADLNWRLEGWQP